MTKNPTLYSIFMALAILPFTAPAQDIKTEIIELATKQMNKNMELMDETGDKSISVHEYIAYYHRQAMNYDVDFNLSLNLEEYKQWVYASLIESASENPQIKQELESKKQGVDQSLEASFHIFDGNADGLLDTEELKLIHEKNMRSADFNNDQLLNLADIRALKALMDKN